MITIAVLTLLRAAFYFAFRAQAAPVAAPDLLHAFYLGLKFDARLAAILTLPLLVLRRGAETYIALIAVLLGLVYAADFGSYAYVHQRLNAALLEFLRNPLISMHMIWESYHVVLFALTLAAIVALIVYAVRRTLHQRRREAGFSWLFALVLVACMYGKLSRYPLRWSDAYFSHDRFVGDLAMNPLQYFFETTREKPAAYDVARLRALYPQLVGYLGVDHPDAQTLTFRRTPPLHPIIAGTPNVVLIQLESFAAFKTGAFGNTMNASPNFDALARGGLLFTRHFTPSEKTARALFAVVFGIPDVSPWQASAHNPLTVDQTSIVNAFTGYDKLYFLGGSANWSNIRGMLEHNIDGLRIFEEGSYSAPVVNVWGISDEDLFLAANSVLRKERKPFFAIIQTSGNHRPYDIPRRTYEFHSVHVDEATLRAHGFESEDEYNAFRYLDHSIGLFFAAAGKEPYFSNTIFVLYGDHGTRTGAPASALRLGDLSPVVYHVPLVFYAPRLLPPRRIDTPSSHLDILPTLASMCDRPYSDQTLGIDLLDPQEAARSAAFVFTTFHDPPDLEVFDARGATITRSDDPSPTLARAFYEAARWLLYHNVTSPAAPARPHPSG